VIPFLILLTSALLSGFHATAVYYLVDHWTYEASLCLARQAPAAHCRKGLSEKLDLLPFLTYEIQEISTTSNSSLAKVKIRTPLILDKIFEEKLRTPLRAKDFKVVL